jgi:cytochrome P450
MMNDPRLYKDPERFMPERFLGENPEKDPRAMAFGFGRRYSVSLYL